MPEQQPWLELLQSGSFPKNDTDEPLAGILTQSEWHTLLEQSLDRNPMASWEAYLHLGTMRLHAGDTSGARAAWEASLARKRTAWALRNLAVLARREGEFAKAAGLYVEAQQLKPDLLPLLIETTRTLIDAGGAADFLVLLDTADNRMRQHGRIQLLEVEAGLAVNDLERVGKRLDTGFEIVDYREGDEVLTELWIRYHTERLSRDENRPVDAELMERVRREYPIPSLFDFRMNVPTSSK